MIVFNKSRGIPFEGIVPDSFFCIIFCGSVVCVSLLTFIIDGGSLGTRFDPETVS